MATSKTARTRTVPVKHVAAFGAALATLAVAPAAEAAVVDLQLQGTGQMFPVGTNWNGTYRQLGTTGGSTVLSVWGVNYISESYAWKSVSGVFARAAESNQVYANSSYFSTWNRFVNLTGVKTFAFNATQGALTGQPGWFKLDFGTGLNFSSPILFVEGKIETTRESIHIGTTPEPATAALTALGLLALGARGVRRYREDRKQQADSAAS